MDPQSALLCGGEQNEERNKRLLESAEIGIMQVGTEEIESHDAEKEHDKEKEAQHIDGWWHGLQHLKKNMYSIAYLCL